MMKRWLAAVGVLAVLGAAGAGWLVYSAPAEATVPTTIPVSRGTVEETVLASGVIEASSLVSVGAEVSGRIKSLAVTLGDDVKSGDLIAEIDSLNQENAVKAAEAALANIEAQRDIKVASLDQARVALTRAEQLSPNQLISDADYQAAQLAVQTGEAELKAIDAQIQQAELSVESAQLDLDRTRIVAPSDGTVVAVAVEVGQSVNASSTPPTIVKIANLDRMVVKAEISEADVPRVEAGQSVYFTILGDPNTRIEATLRAVEPAPESILTDSTSASTGTAVYYNGLFDVENPDHKLRISMTANVTIVLAAAEDVLTLPASVLSSGGRDGGYLVSVWNAATETPEPRRIEVGLNNKVTAEIVSGLEEGDMVVSATPAITRSAQSGGNASTRMMMGGPPL
ncbi:MAG: efflux RND transporter periplasmic adaptor subunit [Devosia sp.]